MLGGNPKLGVAFFLSQEADRMGGLILLCHAQPALSTIAARKGYSGFLGGSGTPGCFAELAQLLIVSQPLAKPAVCVDHTSVNALSACDDCLCFIVDSSSQRLPTASSD